MKKPVRKMTESELPRDGLARASVPGWYFRVTETSANAWLVEGSAIRGRTQTNCSPAAKRTRRRYAVSRAERPERLVRLLGM
jgi:hypothetical protein